MISRLLTNLYSALHVAVMAASTGTTGSTSAGKGGTASSVAGATTTTVAKARSSTSSLVFLALIFVVAGVYFAFIRPRSQAARRMQTQQQQFEIGDRVLTRAGIVGYVVGFVGDRVQLEIAQGVVIEAVRQAIAQRLPDQLDEEEDVPPPPGADDEHDPWDDQAGDDEGDEVDEEADPADDFDDGETEDEGGGADRDHETPEPKTAGPFGRFGRSKR